MMNKKTFDNEVYLGEAEGDYLRFVSIHSTLAQRKKFMIGDIFINAAVCVKCKDYIRSKNVHDFKYCSCGAVAVDGGSWDIRRIGEPEDYINVIENFAVTKEDETSVLCVGASNPKSEND